MGVQFSGNILVQTNGGPLPISSGGTGQTTASTAINALLPSQTSNSGKYLTTDGTNISWATVVDGVSSFNTRTGAVTLTSGDVTTALTYTPVNKTGDTMTGALTATGFVGPLTGNASTATALATPRAINGVNFDGTAPITVTAAANTLTGTTLNSTVVTSSLTSVGTLSSLTVSGTTTATSVSVASTGLVYAATLTTSTTTADQVVSSAAIATYRSVKYAISITSGSAYQYTEVAMIHDGTNVYITENCTVRTGANLATFAADISAGNMRLLTTPVNAVIVIKSIATAIVV